jgi:hypothetical protein
MFGTTANPIVAISATFIYKTVYVPTKHGNGEYASFYAFVKKFSKCDSISTIRRTGGNGPMLQDDSLTISIIASCVHPNQWLDSTIYENKGA